jgi:hypothetical protein
MTRAVGGSTDAGFVMLAALVAIALLSAVGAAMIGVSASEALVAANHRDAIAARYAAESVVARAVADLGGSDVASLLAGTAAGSLWDSGASTVTLADGSALNLHEIRNAANCGSPAPCSPADLAGSAGGERPWGTNNPLWQFYERGYARDMAPAFRHSSFYVLAFVADDPLEADGDPGRTNPICSCRGQGACW